MISAVLISLLFGFAVGCISTLLAYECPKCKCDCDNKKQLLKG
jgi:hypothetical protein